MARNEVPVEKRFPVLVQISRASHFAWRQAVVELCKGADAVAVVNKMWELTGHDTAAAYVKRLDPKKPLAMQFAKSIEWSSQCMGEDAEALPGKTDNEAYLKHHGCPWFDWHKRLGLLAEDRPGCDVWFQVTIDDINRQFGTKLRFETTEALPDGGACCLRRFWVEK
jgi:hypothetical protein